MLNEDLKDAIDILPWSKSGPHRITSGKGKGFDFIIALINRDNYIDNDIYCA